jgi:hypothetical protein
MNISAWPLPTIRQLVRNAGGRSPQRAARCCSLPSMCLFSCYVGIGRRTCLNYQGHEPTTAIRTSNNVIVIFSSFGLFSTTDGNSTEAIEAGLHAR